MKNLKLGLSALSVFTMMTAASPTVQAGSDPLIGEIMMTGFNFCPRGWAEANGNLLPVSQYSALFSLLGTQYGGDGRTTFALPDYRGRVPIGVGQGPGLTKKTQGQKGGAETVVNKHGAGSIKYLAGKEGAKEKTKEFAEEKTANFAADWPHPANNQPPFLAIRVCIALQGVFPPRN